MSQSAPHAASAQQLCLLCCSAQVNTITIFTAHQSEDLCVLSNMQRFALFTETSSLISRGNSVHLCWVFAVKRTDCWPKPAATLHVCSHVDSLQLDCPNKSSAELTSCWWRWFHCSWTYMWEASRLHTSIPCARELTADNQANRWHLICSAELTSCSRADHLQALLTNLLSTA